jgi:hypothetical protein
MMVNYNSVLFKYEIKRTARKIDSQPLRNSPEHEVILRTISERIQAIDTMVTVSRILLQVKGRRVF